MYCSTTNWPEISYHLQRGGVGKTQAVEEATAWQRKAKWVFPKEGAELVDLQLGMEILHQVWPEFCSRMEKKKKADLRKEQVLCLCCRQREKDEDDKPRKNIYGILMADKKAKGESLKTPLSSSLLGCPGRVQVHLPPWIDETPYTEQQHPEVNSATRFDGLSLLLLAVFQGQGEVEDLVSILAVHFRVPADPTGCFRMMLGPIVRPSTAHV